MQVGDNNFRQSTLPSINDLHVLVIQNSVLPIPSQEGALFMALQPLS
jgi:hypothetical protein